MVRFDLHCCSDGSGIVLKFQTYKIVQQGGRDILIEEYEKVLQHGGTGMPAYFSMVIECDREHIYGNILQDFHDCLILAGMKSPRGYWQFMDMPIDEIIAVNQKKLEENYELGYEDSAEKNYIHTMYDFEDFSEVRLFIMNHPEEGIFTLHIIIPEDELLSMKNGSIAYDEKKIKPLTELAKKLWELEFVDLIQTCLELSDDIDNLSQIKEGAALAVEPFAIVPADIEQNIPGEYCTTRLNRDGILVSVD